MSFDIILFNSISNYLIQSEFIQIYTNKVWTLFENMHTTGLPYTSALLDSSQTLPQAVPDSRTQLRALPHPATLPHTTWIKKPHTAHSRTPHTVAQRN